MEYKASLDTLAKVITLSVFILFLVFGYRSIKALLASQGNFTTILIHAVLLLIYIIVLIGSYIYAPQSYKVDANYVTIVRVISDKKIKLKDIVEIKEIAGDEMGYVTRTFGIGGLFGYYGKYYGTKIGSINYYATQRSNKILITTKEGETIVITPNNQNIVEFVKEKITHE